MTTKDYELIASGIYMAVIDDGNLEVMSNMCWEFGGAESRLAG